MAYDRRHVYLTFGGALAGSEQWTTGLRFGHPEAGTGDHNVTVEEWTALRATDPASSLFAVLNTWFTSGNSGAAIGALAKLSWVKLAYVDLDGRYVMDPWVAEQAAVTPPVTTPLPPQCSYVISLRSGSGIGRANYGRMYTPPPTWLVGQNNGLATTTEASNARTAAKTMITGIRSRLNSQIPGVQPLLMSKLGLGETKAVTEVGVGLVVDTQRRRRNQLNEATTLVAL